MEKYVSLNLWSLRVIGVWHPQSNSRFEMRLSLLLRLITVASLLFILIPGGIAAEGYLRRFDVSRGVETLAFLISATVVLCKTLNFYLRRNKIQTLLERMSDIWLQASDDDLKSMTSFAKLGKTVTKLYAVLGLSSIVSFGAQPFLNSILSNGQNDSRIIVSLPFEGWEHLTMNRSQSETPIVLVFTGHVLAGSLASAASIGHDCLFVVLILHVCANLRAIATSLTRLTFLEEDRDVEGEVVRCGRSFRGLIEYTKELENILSIFLLGQSVSSTFVLCLTSFLMSRDIKDNKEIFKYTSYWFAALFQLFIFCWAADHLQTEADTVGRSAYEAYGNLMSLNFKSHERHRHLRSKISRYLLMILLRSQAPLKITAGNFYVMSLESYKNMLSNSYSYFTLLRAFAADKKLEC